MWPLLLVIAVQLPQAQAWINLRESGKELTFQTNVQVGDWQYDTTGSAKDLFVTGDVHIGKNFSSVHIVGDTYASESLFANAATVQSFLVTQEVRSTDLLSFKSGARENIEFHPGKRTHNTDLGSSLDVKSDIFVQDHKLVSDFLTASSALVLGDLLYDVETATFNQSSVTFALAEDAAIVINQDQSDARLVVQSTDTHDDADATLLLRNSAGVQYDVAATSTGNFEVALQDGSSLRLLYGRFDPRDASVQFRLSGGLKVSSDGTKVWGGVQVQDLGMQVRGGTTIVGGVRVTDVGLTVEDGAVSVVGGLSITDGLVVTDQSLLVRAGGVSVSNSGLRIASGGTRISRGGLTVRASGFKLTGGMVARDEGMTVNSGGATVQQGGTIVSDVGVFVSEGTLRVQADGSQVTGGLRLIQPGLTVDGVDGARIEAGGAVVTGGATILDAGFDLDGSACEPGCGDGGNPAATGLCSDGSHPLVCGVKVLADGLTVSGGVTVVDSGITLDGKSLRYIASAVILDGRVGVNDRDGPSMLDVGASWGADLGIFASESNRGDAQLLARGGAAPADFSIRISGSDEPGVAYYQWKKDGEEYGALLELRSQDLNSWHSLGGDVEIMFVADAIGDIQFREDDTWSVVVTPVNPLRVQDAAGDRTYHIMPNGTFHTDANVSVGAGLTVSDGLSVLSRACADFDARGGCTATDVGLDVRRDGAEIRGGMVVSDTGLAVTGATRISAGGSTISGGLLVPDVGLDITSGGLASGSANSDGRVTIAADGMRVVHDGLTVRDTGLQLGGGVDLTGLVQVDGGTTIVDAGLTVSLGDLSLAGGWESRFGINTSTPQMMLDVHSRSAVTEVQFLPAHDTEDDLVVHGLYTGPSASTFDLEIDSAGGTDTFKWRKCTYASGSTHCDELYHEGVPVSESAVYLTEGISVAFGRVDGHQRRDRWRIDVSPTNALASVRAGATESSFSVGQDGSVQVLSGATVSSGVSVSASGIQVGADIVMQTGLQVDGAVAVTSGGLVVHDGLHVEAGVSQMSSNAEIIEGLRVSSPGNMHSAGRVVVEAGGVTLDSAVIASQGLRAVDTGMTVASGGFLVGAGDVDVNRGIVVSAGGIQMASGLSLESAAGQSLDVQAGGASVSGALSVVDSGMSIALGGLSVEAGGLSVENGGVQSDSGMTVTGGGLDVRGGVISYGATSVQGGGMSVGVHAGGVGLRVRAGGARVDTGSLHVSSDGTNLEGGAWIDGGIRVEAGSMLVPTDGMRTAGLIDIPDGGLDVVGGLRIDSGELDVGRTDAADLLSSSGLRVVPTDLGFTSAVTVQGGLRSSADGLAIRGGGAAADVGLDLAQGDWMISAGAVGMNRGGASASYSLDVQSLTLADSLLGLRNADSAARFDFASTDGGTSNARFYGATTIGGKLLVRSNGLAVDGPMEVVRGGLVSAGGDGTLIDGGMTARSGATISGGQVVEGGGVRVQTSGVNVNAGVRVQSDGATVNDQLRIVDTGIFVETGGLHTVSHAEIRGGMGVTEGIQLHAGTVMHQGATVTGGIRASGAVFGAAIGGNIVTQNGKRVGLNNAHPQYMLDLASRSTIRQPHYPGLLAMGTYTGHTDSQLLVEIDFAGSVDSFTWTKDGEVMASNVPIASQPQLLMEGVSIQFLSMSGHAAGDQWLLEVKPVNAIGSASLSGSPGFTVGQNGEVHVEGGARVENGLLLSDGDMLLRSANINANGQIAVHSSLRVDGRITADGGVGIAAGAVVATGHLVVGGSGMAISGGTTVRADATISSGDATFQGDAHVGTSSNVQGVLTVDAVTVQCTGLLVDTGGMAVSGGVSVMSGGVEVSTGGLNVVADGLRSAGGARVVSGGMSVQGGGISVNTGGASSAGGVHVGDSSGGTGVLVRSGGLVVQQEGAELTGGLVVMSGGVTTSDGLHVNAGGTSVLGGLTTDVGIEIAAGGARVSDGGVSINDAGTDRLVSIRARSQVQTIPDSHNSATDSIVFGGTYTGPDKAFFEVVIHDEDGLAGGTTFHWRKCSADGFASLLAASKRLCSPFSTAQTVTVETVQLQQGVWVRFTVLSGHAHGDTWVAHVSAVDPVGLRAANGHTRHAFGQDGSSLVDFGASLSEGMHIKDGLHVHRGGARVAGGLNSARIWLTGDMAVSAGGLDVHHGEIRLQSAFGVTGGASIAGIGLAAGGGASLSGTATISGGTVVVNGGLTSNDGVGLAGGLTVNHPGLLAVSPVLQSPLPLRVLGGHILLNEALPSHSLSVQSKAGSQPLRTQSADGRVGLTVAADGSFAGRSGVRMAGGVSVAGSAWLSDGVQVHAGGARMAGTVQVSTGMAVNVDGAQIAGSSVVNDGLTVSGRVRVAGGHLGQNGPTTIAGGLQVGSNQAASDDVESSGGFGISGGAEISGSAAIAGLAILRTGGARVLSGSVDAYGGLVVDGGVRTSSESGQPGLRVQAGGADIAGGLDSHGLRISSGGLAASGGATIAAAGATFAGGLRVDNIGLLINSGGTVVAGTLGVNSGHYDQVVSSQGSSSILAGVGNEAWIGVFVPGGSYTGSIECGQMQIGIDGVHVDGDTFSWTMCQRPCTSSVYECAPANEFVPIVGDQATPLADGITITFSTGKSAYLVVSHHLSQHFLVVSSTFGTT